MPQVAGACRSALALPLALQFFSGQGFPAKANEHRLKRGKQMLTAEQVYVIEEGEDLLVICKACQTVVSRIPSFAKTEAEGHQADLEDEVRRIRDLHMAKCPGDLT
jgi:hypothetical protein